MNKHAVILSGGGANGAYEVGVMAALFGGECPSTDCRPVDPVAFSGTSVGSYNAAASVALWQDLDGPSVAAELRRLWMDRIAEDPDTCSNGVYRFRGDLRKYIDPRCLAANPRLPARRIADDVWSLSRDFLRRANSFVSSSESLDRRAIEALNLSSLVDNEPLRKLVSETIALDKIRESPRALSVAATNWDTGKLKVFRNEDMTEEVGHSAILASCSIPVFFPVVPVGSACFVDGGVVLNTPLLPALEAGADTLHVIYLDPDLEDIPAGGLPNSMDSLCRMLVIMLAEYLNRDIELVEAANRIVGWSGNAAAADKDPGLVMKMAQIVRDYGEDFPLGRKLTVHRYRPKEVLSSLVGILKFGRSRLRGLIETGYQDALSHDCGTNGCILPS